MLGKKCIEESCINEQSPKRTRCTRCNSKRIRESDRVRFALWMIKKSAKKRRLPFEIELEWFREFCKKSGYIENKGRFSDQMSIDRIIPELGYIQDNIQVVSKSENSKKYHAEEKNVWLAGGDYDDKDLPF